jgi:hypothetical protein
MELHIMHETYTYTLQEGRGAIVWGVTLAKLLALGGGLGLAEVDREQQSDVATTYEITEAKVAAADITQPGIAAPILWDGDPAICPAGPGVYPD